MWVLSTSWQGNNYIFAMNGQTGKFVGNLPVDKAAARKWTLGLTAAVGAASYAVMWLLCWPGFCKGGTEDENTATDCAPSVLRWPHWCCCLRWPHLAFAAENGFADLYYRVNDSAEVLTEDEDGELEASLEELSVRQSLM